MDSKARSTWLQFVLLLLVAGVLTWLAFRGQDLAAIGRRIVAARWEWVLLSVALTLLGHLSRARRWQLLIAAAGHRVGFWPGFFALMTGYLSSLGIPRIGELSRCASLSRLEGVPILALGGTVVAERVVDLLCFGLLLLATMLGAGAQLQGFWDAHIAGAVAGLLQPQRLAGILAALVGIGLIGWLILRHRSGGGPWQRVQAWAASLWEGMRSVTRLQRPWAFALHTVLVWLSYYCAPLCSLMALGLGGGDVLSLAFVVFVFGSLARTLPLPAGSVGAYHFIVSQLMVAFGYAQVDGLSLATLNHATQTVFYLLVGLAGVLGFLVLERRAAALRT